VVGAGTRRRPEGGESRRTRRKCESGGVADFLEHIAGHVINAFGEVSLPVQLADSASLRVVEEPSGDVTRCIELRSTARAAGTQRVQGAGEPAAGVARVVVADGRSQTACGVVDVFLQKTRTIQRAGELAVTVVEVARPTIGGVCGDCNCRRQYLVDARGDCLRIEEADLVSEPAGTVVNVLRDTADLVDGVRQRTGSVVHMARDLIGGRSRICLGAQRRKQNAAP
jgi:hypothetical protein